VSPGGKSAELDPNPNLKKKKVRHFPLATRDIQEFVFSPSKVID
jgi:hypothetical protein